MNYNFQVDKAKCPSEFCFVLYKESQASLALRAASIITRMVKGFMSSLEDFTLGIVVRVEITVSEHAGGRFGFGGSSVGSLNLFRDIIKRSFFLVCHVHIWA